MPTLPAQRRSYTLVWVTDEISISPYLVQLTDDERDELREAVDTFNEEADPERDGGQWYLEAVDSLPDLAAALKLMED